MFWEALKRSGPELWCLCGVQGQIGRVAGSSICRQDSSPSGASCLTNLPHTHFKSTHKHRYRCCSHSQINSYTARKCVSRHTHAKLKESTGVQKIVSYMRIEASWPGAFCICLAVFFFFFPCGGSPPPSVGGKRAPGDGRLCWLTAGEFGGQGASKAALLLSLALSPPATSSISFKDTSQKNNSSLLFLVCLYLALVFICQ